METKDFEEDVIDLRVYFSIIARWWWLILIFSGISGATACVVSIYKEPIYEADVLMMVGTGLEEPNPSSSEMQTSRSLAPTYVVLVETYSILQDTAVALELPYPPQVKVDASVIPNTQLVRVVVTGPSPKLVAAIANGLAEQLVKQNPQQQLDREFNESATNYIRVVEPARIPTGPTGPKVFQNTMVGALVGLMMAVGASFIVDFFDDTIKDQEHVQQKLGLETLGAIPSVPSDGDTPEVITPFDKPSLSSEAYGKLGISLLNLLKGFERSTVLVTSPGAKEGKSTVAANLAVAMAMVGGKKVIAVGADMHHPSLYKFLGLPNETGLGTLLGDSLETLEQVLQTTTIASLRILTSGPVPKLLNPSKMTGILRQLSESADIVVVDAPPTFLSDVSILAGMVAGVILVVEVGQTSLKDCSQAVYAIEAAGGKVLGVVWLGVKPKKDNYYYPYYPAASGNGRRRGKRNR